MALPPVRFTEKSGHYVLRVRSEYIEVKWAESK